VAEIRNEYGDIRGFCNRFSYANMNSIVQNPIDVFKRESPTLVRIDVTYGKNSSATWLFGVLQSMLVFLNVTNDKFSKEQVYMLAQTISTQYKTLKVEEILLFVSRFMAGKYGRFYGGDSYALVITESLNKFMAERGDYYAEIERTENVRRIEEGNKGVVTFEEYKRMKEAKGESVSGALKAFFG
jgi:hypothetical protein